MAEGGSQGLGEKQPPPLSSPSCGGWMPRSPGSASIRPESGTLHHCLLRMDAYGGFACWIFEQRISRSEMQTLKWLGAHHQQSWCRPCPPPPVCSPEPRRPAALQGRPPAWPAGRPLWRPSSGTASPCGLTDFQTESLILPSLHHPNQHPYLALARRTPLMCRTHILHCYVLTHCVPGLIAVLRSY